MEREDRHGDHRLHEQTLHRVRGVVTAKVTGPADSIEGVHVLANGERDTKLLVRDILSALFTCHDVHLRAEQIKVVQSTESAHLGGGEQRPRLLGMNYHLSQGWGRAGVQLELGNAHFFGMAEGPSTLGNRARLLAVATAEAVQSCLGECFTVTVEHVGLVDMGFDRAILVAVSLSGTQGDEVLTGSCLVRGDEWEAVVKATLNCLNRRFTSSR